MSLFIAERQAGSCEYQFCNPWFDPTENRTRVSRFSNRRSIHSTADWST